MTDSFEQFWMRRAKTLTQALIISGTINIGLLGSFVCFILKEKQAAFSVEPQQLPRDPSEHISNEKILQAYSALSFQELLLELENTQLIEEGYTKRDLALASLSLPSFSYRSSHRWNDPSKTKGIFSEPRCF